MSNLNDSKNGYGTAGFGVVTSLQRLGHQVPFRDLSAPVQLNFSQPHLTEYGNNWNILYLPWESTEIPEHWLEYINDADEVWATSEFVKNVIESYGFPVSKVYHHGVDPVWTPKKRERGRKLRFLHHGAPAPRKGGQIALEAFREAFGDQTDVHLTFKSFKRTLVYAPGGNGRLSPAMAYDNVSVDSRNIEVESLVGVYHDHDALVYPSYGEGFGFIPLQGMITGMPTICTEAWAPYKDEILPDLRLSSTLAPSKWESIHPGMVYEPSFEHLVEMYRHVYDNFEQLSIDAFDRSEKIRADYDWDTLTSSAFQEIVIKFS